MTRRGLQIALGFLWLLDGGLQLQPFMLGTGFARQIVTVSADGQPQFLAVPVHWAADVIAAHPVAWDVPFATVQLLIGVGLLVPRTARLALAASVPWALGVWLFGEGCDRPQYRSAHRADGGRIARRRPASFDGDGRYVRARGSLDFEDLDLPAKGEPVKAPTPS